MAAQESIGEVSSYFFTHDGFFSMKLIDDLDMYAYRKGWPRWASVLMPLLYPSTWPIVVYRYGVWVVALRFAVLRLPLYAIYFIAKRLTEILTTVEISERADIGGGLSIAHIGSVIISHHSKLGEHAALHQGVTIGGDGLGGGFPTIGDRVYFGAGAKILGPVKIGNDVVIGANAVVTRDVPANSIVVGVPAKVQGQTGSQKLVHFRGERAS